MTKKKFNVDKHMLTPKHLKLGDKEKSQLFEKYDVTEKEMPKIFKTDSAIISLDVKVGDVVKIVRKSPTAGESMFYRVVVDV
ncbi:DNA-directed RNA polymerase subunit H [Candidatus Woesearchaeota archaeon]|nr:DNA-directed RNA polymerase subunit H [Candidatus Woesearchaeota archaeon]